MLRVPFYVHFYVNLRALKAPFCVSTIVPLLKVDEISSCVHKFIFLQLCYFLLFSVLSELYYLLHISDSVMLMSFFSRSHP